MEDKCRSCFDPISAAKEWIKNHGVIERDICEPVPDKPGYSRRLRPKTLREVWAQLEPALNAHSEQLCAEYYAQDDWGGNMDKPLPERNRMSVYAVQGANEGYYVHIDVLNCEGQYMSLGLIKCLGRWEETMKIVVFVTMLLESW